MRITTRTIKCLEHGVLVAQDLAVIVLTLLPILFKQEDGKKLEGIGIPAVVLGGTIIPTDMVTATLGLLPTGSAIFLIAAEEHIQLQYQEGCPR